MNDECCSLSPEGKNVLMEYGSTLINNIKFRDNFVMIGQKGLAQGSAIEQVHTHWCLLYSFVSI